MTKDPKREIDEWALHAYLDGEAAADMRADIEAYLSEHREAAERVEAWRRQKQALKQAYAGVLDEPLSGGIAAALQGQSSHFSRFQQMAAALTLLFVGTLAGWFAGHQSGPLEAQSIARDALVAHQVYASEVRHPIEVSASEGDHLAAWLSKRLGHTLKLPDLTGQGYTLLGGRLLAAQGRPAALLMYEDQNKRRITLFLIANRGEGESALQIETSGSVTACYWLDGPFGFAVAGELDRDRLMSLARDVYAQFAA